MSESIPLITTSTSDNKSIDAITSTSTITTPPPPPSAITTTNTTATETKTKLPKKKSAPRRLKVKRKGAKVEEDEGEDEGKISTEAVSDSSDSDISAAADEDDEEGEDSDDEEDKKDDKVKIPISSVVIPPVTLHPSWSDLPAVGEVGSTDLPVLEFSNLTLSKLVSIPSSPILTKNGSTKPQSTSSPITPLSTPLTPDEIAAKKAAGIANREAKSAAAKERDPIAWEAGEVARKEKEIERKKEKRERSKEKKKQERLLNPRILAPSTTTVLPPVTSTSTIPVTREPRPPKAPRNNSTSQTNRISNPTPSTSTVPSAQSNKSTERSNRPPQNNNKNNNQNSNRFTPPTPLYIQAAQAREEYAEKIAKDPTFTPRLGSHFLHDARLAAPGAERLLNPFWRGRGRDGELRGGGRGGRNSRGGGRNGSSNDGPGFEEDRPLRKVEIKKEDEVKDDDDDWGRGEAKRTTKNSSTPTTFPAVSDWNHDGFEELKSKPPRNHNVSIRGGASSVRGGRGGRGGNQSNGIFRTPGQQQALGEINPRFAHLPFHPNYRFAVVTPVAPEETTISRPDENESLLFGEEGFVVKGVVKLPNIAPGAEVEPSPVPKVKEIGIKVNLGGSSAPVVPAPKSEDVVVVKVEETLPVEEKVVEKVSTEEVSPRGGNSVLYPVESDSNGASGSTIPPLSNYQQPPHQQQQYQQQYQQQQQQQQQPYYRQLPPHLQHQQQQQQSNLPFAPRPQHFIPRNGSPAFYPHPQFYSPDHVFPNMITPGITPPPMFNQGGPSSYLPPARNSKVDIRDPSALHKSSLSAVGDTFAPRSVPPHLQRDSIISTQSSNSNPYGYSPYEGEDYSNQNNNNNNNNQQMMYYQQQQQQHQQQLLQQQGYYDSYGGGNGYQQHQSHQSMDPAILAMSSGYNYDSRGNGGGRGSQQQQGYYQQQSFGNRGGMGGDGSPPFDSGY